VFLNWYLGNNFGMEAIFPSQHP